jgi:hypothetical protein
MEFAEKEFAYAQKKVSKNGHLFYLSNWKPKNRNDFHFEKLHPCGI